MRLVFVAVVLLFASVGAWAQFPSLKKGDVADYLSRKHLLVVFQNMDDEVKQNVKDLMTTAYTIDQQVKYVDSWSEMNKVLDASPGKYAVLNVAKYNSWTNTSGGVTTKGDIYAIGGMIKNDKGHIVWVIPLLSPSGHTRFHIHYALNAISRFLPKFNRGEDPWDVDEDLARLAKKTLLVPEGSLDEYTSMDDVKAAYNGKVEMVPASKMIEIVDKRDTDYAILVNLMNSRTAYVCYSIVDVETFDLLSTVAVAFMTMGTTDRRSRDHKNDNYPNADLSIVDITTLGMDAKRFKSLSDPKTQRKHRRY